MPQTEPCVSHTHTKRLPWGQTPQECLQLKHSFLHCSAREVIQYIHVTGSLCNWAKVSAKPYLCFLSKKEMKPRLASPGGGGSAKTQELAPRGEWVARFSGVGACMSHPHLLQAWKPIHPNPHHSHFGQKAPAFLCKVGQASVISPASEHP